MSVSLVSDFIAGNNSFYFSVIFCVNSPQSDVLCLKKKLSGSAAEESAGWKLVKIKWQRLKSACTSQVEQHEQTSLGLLSCLNARLSNSVSSILFFFFPLLLYLINELNYSHVLRFLSPRHSLFLSFVLSPMMHHMSHT